MHPNEARTKWSVKAATKWTLGRWWEEAIFSCSSQFFHCQTLRNEPDPPTKQLPKRYDCFAILNPQRETRLKLRLLRESWHNQFKEEDVLSVKSGGWLYRTQKSQGRWGRCGAESPWILPTFPSGIFPEALHFVFDGWWQV